MKKTIYLLVSLFFTLSATAQYDEVFAFWHTALSPDNSLALVVKKEGYKTLTVVCYESDEVGDAQEKLGETVTTYDGKGRIATIAETVEGSKKEWKYEYDRSGKVIKYTYPDGNLQHTFEFEYDKRKGFKQIRATDTRYSWDSVKYVLTYETETEVRNFYFYKTGLPEKYIKTNSNKGKNKNVYHTDTIHYRYDRTGNLIHYRRVEGTPQDIDKETIAELTYNLQKGLTQASITEYDYSFSDEQPKAIETHSYDFAEGAKAPDTYAMNRKQYAYEAGHLVWDEEDIKTTYTYNEKGLPVSLLTINMPGLTLLYTYRFDKK